MVPRDLRLGQQRHEGGGGTDGEGGAVFEEGVEDDAGLEAVGQGQCPGVRHTGREFVDHAGDVEERREGEVGRALGDAAAGALALGVEHDVAVGVHGALGRAAGARGVADEGGVVRGEPRVGGAVRAGAGHGAQVVGVGRGGGAPAAQHTRVVAALEVVGAGGEGDADRGVGGRGPQVLRPGVVAADQRGHLGVAQDVADLAGLVHRVDGDGDAARLPDAEQRDHEVRGVLERDHGAVAAPEAALHEVGRYGVGEPVGLGVGQPAVEVGERGAVGGAAHRGLEGVQDAGSRVDGAALHGVEVGEPGLVLVRGHGYGPSARGYSAVPAAVCVGVGASAAGAVCSIRSSFCWRRLMPLSQRSGSEARAV